MRHTRPHNLGDRVIAALRDNIRIAAENAQRDKEAEAQAREDKEAFDKLKEDFNAKEQTKARYLHYAPTNEMLEVIE